HYWCVFTLRNHQWHERDFSGKLASIRAMKGGAPPPDGVAAASWGRATHGLFHTGKSFVLEVGASLTEQVDWLQKIDPAYLLTYPSNIRALAERCLERGIELPGLRQVQSVGEIVTPAMRNASREAWGAPLIDTYSSEEFGYIALQCPSSEGMHIQAENLLVELLDENGRPCAPGETGRLVITGLHNYAMPLIRYEIGDHAVAGERCACGRGLPVLSKILGRTRNMLVKESGEMVWPRFGVRRFREIAPIRQYQAIQKSFTEMHVRLVADRPLTPDQEARLIRHIRESLESPFEIALEYLDEIPRSKGGKYDVFVSEVS
ncbi:MAG: phenylacetate--CoA ligase family protein, partial [Akkermansiaceae bacterium]|nr:phenylacetate--CoA ligase family protein [Akkermansiaceae bacterium]